MNKSSHKIDVPEHLVSASSDYVSLLRLENGRYYAKLPNKGRGYEIEISEADYKEIIKYWDEDKIVLLICNGGQITNNNVIVNSSVNITTEQNDDAIFIN